LIRTLFQVNISEKVYYAALISNLNSNNYPTPPITWPPYIYLQWSASSRQVKWPVITSPQHTVTSLLRVRSFSLSLSPLRNNTFYSVHLVFSSPTTFTFLMYIFKLHMGIHVVSAIKNQPQIWKQETCVQGNQKKRIITNNIIIPTNPDTISNSRKQCALAA